MNEIEIVETVQEKVSWEEYVTRGMEAREDHDNANWTHGDLALGITKDYGEDAIGKFAYAVGIAKKTLMNYRTVASKYNRDIREKYRKLSWSHFQTVAPAEKPEAWLEKADTEEWSVETMRKEIKKAYPKIEQPRLDDNPPQVYRCEECGRWRIKDVSAFEVCKGHYEIHKSGMIYK